VGGKLAAEAPVDFSCPQPSLEPERACDGLVIERAGHAGFLRPAIEIVIVLEAPLISPDLQPAAIELDPVIREHQGRLRTICLRQVCEARVRTGPSVELVLIRDDDVSLRSLRRAPQAQVVARKVVIAEGPAA